MDYTGRFPRDLISTPEMKEDLEGKVREAFVDVRPIGGHTKAIICESRVMGTFHFFLVEVFKKPHKTSFNSRKPHIQLGNGEETLNKTSKSRSIKMDVYTRLLLSTLYHDQEYINTLVRRLRYATFVYPSDLLNDTTCEIVSSRHGWRSTSQKRGSVFVGGSGEGERKFAVFKVPHLPHPPRNMSAGTLMAGGLWKRNTLEAGEKGRRWRREQKASQKMARKNSVSTLSVFSGREKSGSMSAFERHSFVGIEHLTARMDVATTRKRGAAGEEDGRISRHPSNVSECVTKSSSDDDVVFDSVSSSPSLGGTGGGGVRRTSSLSSLVACTEDLFSQYFPSSSSPSQ
ncbi:unnamed protein product [Hydatigera taeniaeformis]|uniref:Uncharacterized protein n=1 Tax=Hydatigena taeniaeformis TaxID=6205 RepID=A0A0R3X209_HYDTA|nr:unnamed protein product [Hydatigera taeniaeformis]